MAVKCSKCGRESPVFAVLRAAAAGAALRCTACTTSARPTFEDVRQALRSSLDDGAKCPCCGQFAKRYRRKLNSAMARWLIALAQLHALGHEWVHISWVAAVVGGVAPWAAQAKPVGLSPIGSGDYAKARYWALVVDRPSADQAKKDSGYWRLTDTGRAFVEGTIKLHAYAVLYNNVCEGFEGGLVSIVDALGAGFDYDELMRS